MSMPARVMVVDDDRSMCTLLRTFLESRGYAATTVTDAAEAVQRFQTESPDIVLLDVVMPGSMDGLAALAAIKKLDKDVPVIVVSGQGRTQTVVQAIRLGADDFICKPFQDAELEALLRGAAKQRDLSRQVAVLRAQLREPGRQNLLLGQSPCMAEVRDLIDRVSDTDVTVLIRGESGTGKELVARALHTRSLRRDKPFVKVNCAALPAELLESELFGYDKGAFTGAVQHKPGKFEFANHGTMFLDEIGDIGGPLQAKLLQVLQDGEFSRLGGTGDVRVDARVIAATNRDLDAAVRDGTFREDLYYRLNVVMITLPPLRKRRDEIPLLVDYFLKKYSALYNKPFGSLSAELERELVAYDWPGNVRQLENLVKRMVVLRSEAGILQELRLPAAQREAPLRSIKPAATPVAVAPPQADAPTAHTESSTGAHPRSLKDIGRNAAREAERELILEMLTRTRWNRKAAAEILGISYKALLYKIKENGLDTVS
jgi:two-component system, NtrC family, response regulator AtoC